MEVRLTHIKQLLDRQPARFDLVNSSPMRRTAGEMKIVTLIIAAVFGSGAIDALGATEPAKVDPNAVNVLARMSACLRSIPAFQITMLTQRDDVDVYGQLITLSGAAIYRVRRPDALYIDLALPSMAGKYVSDGNVNVNRNVNVNGGGYNNGCCGGGYNNGVYHPVAASAAVGDLSAAFARIARSLRLTLALQARAEEQLRALLRPARRELAFRTASTAAITIL
jgi:hypothetical protein